MTQLRRRPTGGEALVGGDRKVKYRTETKVVNGTTTDHPAATLPNLLPSQLNKAPDVSVLLVLRSMRRRSNWSDASPLSAVIAVSAMNVATCGWCWAPGCVTCPSAFGHIVVRICMHFHSIALDRKVRISAPSIAKSRCSQHCTCEMSCSSSRNFFRCFSVQT